MRILLVIALTGVMAACVPPPPPEAAAAPLSPSPSPIVAAPTTLAAPPPPQPVPAVYVPNPLTWLFTAFVPPPAAGPGRVTLSNFDYDVAHVQAVITPFPDCQQRAGTAISDFELPLNGTRIIAVPPGNDVCWRRALPAGPSAALPAGAQLVAGWTEWSRVFTASGRSIDSRL